jgi:thioredoxin reductase
LAGGVTDIWIRTCIPGVFAAGEIRQHSAAQLAASARNDSAAAADVLYLNEQ